jgi:hypothetical protein
VVPQGKARRFPAEIYEIGINRCVDVPERVSRALGPGKHIPVIGKVEGEMLRSTLVPRGGGLHRFFIHSKIWRKLGVDSGDTVRITLNRDRQAGDVQLPREIAAAFPTGSEALTVFNAQSAATRRRFVSWVMEARTPMTRDRRVRKFVETMRKKQQNKNKR